MIYLDSSTDSILPYGLKGTPFETVFEALQAVASTVWPVDAAELRAAIGWGWYLDNNIEKLILLSAGKQYIQNILISEQVPLIKSTQTQEELVDLLYRWKNYKPTFDKLEDLYIPYAARVDIRPITDEATQEILPVTDIHNAFYVVLTDIDWSRPLTLSEAALIAERATPMGSHPIAVFQFEETTNVYPQLAYGDVNFYTGTLEPAAEPTPPEPETQPYYMVIDETTGEVEHYISDGDMITVYETGVRTESFYFTTNGRNETQNTNISHSDIPVYNEDGTAPAADTPYDGSSVLAFMDVTGNTKQADGESLYLDDGALRLDAPDTDEGEQWAALVEYIEPAPPFPEVHSMTGRLGSSSSSSGDSTKNFSILSNGRLWFFKLEGGSYSKAVVNEGTVLAVAKINNSSDLPEYYGFVARRVASDGTVRLMNNNYATYNNATSADIYYCEDPSVGVATVTNGNGDKFWAFKYIVDGAAYYYVLDLSSGSLPSQSWVSDLSSLGYTLFNATLYYLSSPKEPIVISSNGYSNLLLDNGNYLSYNSSRKYRIINAYTSETDSIGIGCESFWVSSSMSLATLYNSDVAHAFYSVEIVIT